MNEAVKNIDKKIIKGVFEHLKETCAGSVGWCKNCPFHIRNDGMIDCMFHFSAPRTWKTEKIAEVLADEYTYFRVKYGRRIIGQYQTRHEAVEKCKDYARKITPVVVNPSALEHAAVVFKIEMIRDGKTVSTENYTEIIAMKR